MPAKTFVVSLMASFVLSFFPLDVLDEIWDLIESVSEGFLTYSLRVRLVCLIYCMLQLFVFQVKTYIKSTAFQSNSELFTTENILPSTDKVTVDLVHNYFQQLHLLALHLEVLGYMPGF